MLESGHTLRWQIRPDLSAAQPGLATGLRRIFWLPCEICRNVSRGGVYQIGEAQARSWIVGGSFGFGSTPARSASHVDQRHDGFSSTRT
jgi:hypothetical protein